MAIPSEIKKEHIIQAIEKIDEEGIPLRNESKDYDLLWNNKHYPPKLLISYAHQFANGSILDTNTFSGGKESNDFLKNLGFTVHEKINSNKRYWLFHSNPTYWDSKSEIFQNDSGYFRVSKKHEHEVKIGDEFAFYISGKEAGIYAFGTIKSEPILIANDIEVIKKYGNETEKFLTKKLRALLNYEIKLIDSPINRKVILQNKVFENNNFFINPQGVNVTKISEEEFQEIKNMMPNNINYYWVNQSDTYQDGKLGEYIWAPDNSNKKHHHQDLKKLKKGDIIVHYHNKKIVATSVVQNTFKNANDPTGGTNENGSYVSTTYSELEKPIELTTIIQLLKNKNVLPEKYSPINTDWKINQGYLYIFTKEAYDILFSNKSTNDKFLNLIEPKNLLNKMNSIISKTYITSLITKPFVIITGNSGTGKTRIALRLAELFNNSDPKTYALVPVGADWTDNRNVIGFYDAINNVYRSTPILDLLLDAKVNTNKPFFLILDEMNLSHVERYFADFLSAMESGKEIPLHNRVETVLSDSQKKIPKAINLPDNVYITGTVNIDETTYMFSPKVLDRANVIEFKVAKEDITNFLNSFGGEDLQEVAAEGVAESFLNLSLELRSRPIRERIQEDNDPLFNEGLKEVKSTLEKLFATLEGSNMEFAYRTMEEILRYMKVSFELAEKKESWDWKENIDTQILQKILPKLHGSKRKMERILIDLESICKDLEFKNSKIKLDRMIKTLQTDQFVSFI